MNTCFYCGGAFTGRGKWLDKPACLICRRNEAQAPGGIGPCTCHCGCTRQSVHYAACGCCQDGFHRELVPA